MWDTGLVAQRQAGSFQIRDQTLLSCTVGQILYHWATREARVYVHAQSLSHVWLCNPVDCSPPGSSVHGIFQARILEWVAISRGSSQPRNWTFVSCIGRRILYHWVTWEAQERPHQWFYRGRDERGAYKLGTPRIAGSHKKREEKAGTDYLQCLQKEPTLPIPWLGTLGLLNCEWKKCQLFQATQAVVVF